MLDLDPARADTPPRDASTLVVVRDSAKGEGIEVFCVERQKAGFLGGAVVFPGGKLDPGDLDPAWAALVTSPRAWESPNCADESALRGLAVAACREALEEAAILPVDGARPVHSDLLEWRRRLAHEEATLRELLEARGLRLDLAALHPLARWITPISESRRFDTRFFLFVADASLTGAHDDHETTASFWAAPGEVLRRFGSRELQLAPPTHRTLEVLATARHTRDALAIAEGACLEPVCPRLVTHRDALGETMGLALPGDPEHEVRKARSPGRSRYVLRGDRFVPEDPPST
jgi:8-oxo-dGTP pyrophosphatase MutT (NUDIX family)